MEDKINIGKRIKKLREETGYTQKDLAIKLGLNSETAIANYESGYSSPKDEIKLKLCEIFNCSLDYLMCRTDKRTIEEEFEFAYHKETEGLSDEEIKEAVRIYKQIKYGNNKEKN